MSSLSCAFLYSLCFASKISFNSSASLGESLRIFILSSAYFLVAGLILIAAGGAALHGTHLAGANLTGANLARAILDFANLTDANVYRADLTRAKGEKEGQHD
jgi:uncharacterized protein YjbI with pentapeptide repeats